MFELLTEKLPQLNNQATRLTSSKQVSEIFRIVATDVACRSMNESVWRSLQGFHGDQRSQFEKIIPETLMTF
jgi:hypothetical protein